MELPKRITPDRVVLIGAVVAALAYIQDIRYDFLLDDVPLILMNQTIASWRNWKSAFVTDIFAENKSIFATASAIHYRPIYKLWQMLNEHVFGSVLPWWHLTSLLLHLGVTLLVYQLGIKLLKERWTAALAALLFAVHPIHAESVAYVTASTDLLVAMFTLVSFLAYFHYREEGGSPVYLMASVFAAALAMLSKESAVVLPWMFVAYEALRETPPKADRSWKNFLWTLPFFAVVGAYLAARTMLFGLNAGPGPGGSRLAAFRDMPLVLVTYLRNLLWPSQLSFFYPSEWSTQWTLAKGAAIAMAIAAGWSLWSRYRERSGIRLQLVWTAILFAPPLLSVYALVREDWVHDRHMYLVSIPVCLIAAALLTGAKWPSNVKIAASCVVLAILLADLAVQIPRFSDNISIYSSAEKVAPRSLLLRSYYGTALWGYGRTEEASHEFQIATQLAPQSPATHEWYGGTLVDLGRDDQAMAEYQKALGLSSGNAQFCAYILTRMAAVEMKNSQYKEAATHLEKAVQLSPETPNYHAMYAEALSRQGQTKEAQEEWRLQASSQRRSTHK